MRPSDTTRNDQNGIALLFTLLTLLVLSSLAAAIILVTQTETWSFSNYRMMVQSRYAAEAGAQNTLNWLLYNYTAPTNMSAFDLTKYPVQDSATHNTIVLSAMTGVTANYPTAANTGLSPSVQTAFSSALQDASVPGLGVSASYEVSATLLSMSPADGISWLGGSGGAVQTWQIASQGNVTGIRNAQVQVVMNVQRTATPVFNYAVAATSTGCGALTFGGTDYADSYNSNNGVYGGTNVQTTGANIASNGNVTLGSGAHIGGTINLPSTTVNTTSCAAGFKGVSNSSGYTTVSTPPYDKGTNALSTALSYKLPWNCSATPCYPSPLPSTTAQNVSTSCATITGCTSHGTATIYDKGASTTANVFTLAPTTSSTTVYGNLTIANADVVHLSAGTYDINSLTFSKDGQIVIDSGPVVLDVAGQGFASGSTVVNSGGLSGWNMCAPTVSGGVSSGVTGNPGAYGVASCGSSQTAFSGIPSNFQIVYAGAAAIATTGAPIASVIYAPNALVETTGAAVGMYGSVISNTFLEGSKAPVHYDNAISSYVMQPGPYYPVSFSWSKF